MSDYMDKEAEVQAFIDPRNLLEATKSSHCVAHIKLGEHGMINLVPYLRRALKHLFDGRGEAAAREIATVLGCLTSVHFQMDKALGYEIYIKNQQKLSLMGLNHLLRSESRCNDDRSSLQVQEKVEAEPVVEPERFVCKDSNRSMNQEDNAMFDIAQMNNNTETGKETDK